jgi:hypothetical protein
MIIVEVEKDKIKGTRSHGWGRFYCKGKIILQHIWN